MGIFYFILIISLWILHLFYCLTYLHEGAGIFTIIINMILQAYLYTGLFITAHDAMHGTVSRNKFINNSAGRICSYLFAAISYNKLKTNHMLHHTSPGTSSDPDFYTGSGNFLVWWLVFLRRYTSITQLIIMGIIFNILKIRFTEISLFLFWILPAFISTLQLFYFGTYYPHKMPHTEEMRPHNSRSRKKNHLLAMLSCYFFGYHVEHHSSPGTPWWKLYELK